MSSEWGHAVHISIFGESHGPGVGVVINGLPAGEALDLNQIMVQMSRRAPGQDISATQRREEDIPVILSGLMNDMTTGAPLAAMMENKNTRSGDYENLIRCPRPSHADFTGSVRYHGYNDVRGGGHFSARLTAPLVFAGAVCRQILKRRGITIGGHIQQIGRVKDRPFDPLFVCADQLEALNCRYFSVCDTKAEKAMRNEIEEARLAQDSVGGLVELAVCGLEAGIGSPMFYGVENVLASILFGVPAVKGVEFGVGFAAAEMRGSACNDPFAMSGGKVITTKNNSGGIQGGITNGMPLIARVAIKPTPSIAQTQQSVDLKTRENVSLNISGRHDPCVVPRAVPVLEAAVAVALINLLADAEKL